MLSDVGTRKQLFNFALSLNLSVKSFNSNKTNRHPHLQWFLIETIQQTFEIDTHRLLVPPQDRRIVFVALFPL